MKVELKSIGVWSFVKLAFFINLVLGFLIGLIYAPFLGIIMSLATAGFPEDVGDGFDGFPVGAMMIVIPFIAAIVGGVMYTLGELILVVLYNLFTRLTGGFEFELSGVGKMFVTEPVSSQPQPVPASSRPISPPPPPPVDSSPAPGGFAPENRPPVTPSQPPPGQGIPPVPGQQPPRPPEPPTDFPPDQEPPRN